MPTLDSCINDVYEPGNIGGSSGETPVRIILPTFEDPEEYDPDEVEYSLDNSKFWNSGYLLLLMV